MPTQQARVVILGAGFGGLACAEALNRADVDITIIDRQNYHCFQPLLYQVATAALSPADVGVADPSHFASAAKRHRLYDGSHRHRPCGADCYDKIRCVPVRLSGGRNRSEAFVFWSR